MRKTGFLSLEKLVTIRRWTFLDTFVTFTGSLDWRRRPACAVIRAIPMPSSFPCAAAEKNGLRAVWASAAQVLRSASASDSRSFVRRQTRLSFSECSACGLLALWWSQNRTPGMVVGVAERHPTVRLLCRRPLSRYPGQDSGRGTAAQLAHRQGTRQALHERATPAYPRPQSDR